MATLTRDPYADMQRLLGPHAMASVCDVRVMHRAGPLLIEAEAILAPRDLPADSTDRQIRQSFMDSANDAIEGVEAEGYWHVRAPEITFGGDIGHCGDPRKPPTVRHEVRIRLQLGLLEDRL